MQLRLVVKTLKTRLTKDVFKNCEKMINANVSLISQWKRTAKLWPTFHHLYLIRYGGSNYVYNNRTPDHVVMLIE